MLGLSINQFAAPETPYSENLKPKGLEAPVTKLALFTRTPFW
ncbi:hypothetical protein [Streptomyces erythrochromogenes]